jgi:hypothetical protein
MWFGGVALPHVPKTAFYPSRGPVPTRGQGMSGWHLTLDLRHGPLALDAGGMHASPCLGQVAYPSH